MPLFLKKLIASISKKFGNYPASLITEEYKNIVLAKRSKLNTKESGSLLKKEQDFLDQMVIKAGIYFELSGGLFGFISKEWIIMTLKMLESDQQSFIELTKEMSHNSTRYWKFKDSCKSFKLEIHRDFKALIERKYDR